MRILIILILIISPVAFGQINFFEEYSGIGNDFGQGVVQLPDSSYVITGASSSFSGAQTDAFLLCIDSTGAYKWSTFFGGEESDWGRRVIYVENDGYYVAGYSNSNVGNGFDYYLTKTDVYGIAQWYKYYGGQDWEKVNDAALTRDTGVIMVGEVETMSEGKNGWIVRTDKDGDTLWTKTIGTTGEDFITCIDQWNDSVFVAGGQVYIEDSLMNKGLLYCFKDDGTELWRDTVGPDGNYFFNDIVIRLDTIQGVGAARIDENDDWDAWRVSYLLNTQTMFYDINEHNDGEVIGKGLAIYNWDDTRYMGFSRKDQFSYPDGRDLFFAHQNIYMFTMLSNAGNVARDGEDELGEMISTSDGGMMAVGYTSFRNGVNGNWVYAFKIGPDNSIPYQDQVGNVLQLVGQKELNLKAGIRVFPNPVTNELNIKTEQFPILNGKVYNLTGSVVADFQVEKSSSVQVEQLNSGVYILELTEPESGAVYTEKIVKD